MGFSLPLVFISITATNQGQNLMGLPKMNKSVPQMQDKVAKKPLHNFTKSITSVTIKLKCENE